MRERIEIKFDENTNLIAYKWTNPNVKKIGCVQIAHGINEHVTRYDALANYLTDHGFTVIASDHYHQGESCNDLSEKCVVEAYDFMDSVLKSIQLTREELENEFTGITCLYAHSMGAIVTQTYIQKISDDYKKVILSGADIGTCKYFFLKLLTNKSFRKKDFKTSSKFIYNMTFGGFQKKFKEKSEYNWLTVNPKNVENYENDPLCGGIVPDINLNSMSKYLLESYKFKNILKINPDLKIFLISGKEDPVTNFTKSTIKLHKRYLKAGLRASIKIYDNMRHEPHNETDTSEVYKDILRFLTK